MLASYLSDIELLLEEQRWEQALREAFDLPQIAAALSDLRMQVSVDRVQAWCEQWVKHGEDATAARRRTPDAAGSLSSSASAQTARVSPMSRCPPWRCGVCGCIVCSAHGTADSSRVRWRCWGPEAADTAQICTTLVQAARRWYAQSACHDAVVQANLARLAVLR